jgi:hypothetical protein
MVNLNAAMSLLGQARAKAQANPSVFGGHRGNAIREMQSAHAELQRAIEHVKKHPPKGPGRHYKRGAPYVVLPPGGSAPGRYPNMVQSMQLLAQAVAKAHDNYAVFSGHRMRAIGQMNAARRELRRALEYANAHEPGQVNYPHLVEAMRLLKASHGKAQANPPVFGGHRRKAMERMRAAQVEFERAMAFVKAHPPARSQRRRGAIKAQTLGLPKGDWRGRYPNLILALEGLRAAEKRAHENPPVFGGHAAKAEGHMYVAINEIHRAFHYVNEHPPK